MQSYIEIEVYDNEADCQDDEGRWPTKLIHVSKPWLDEYAKSATRYSSADQLLTNYTYDELEGFEEKARDAGPLRRGQENTDKKRAGAYPKDKPMDTLPFLMQ